jgi:hypothetical protein
LTAVPRAPAFLPTAVPDEQLHPTAPVPTKALGPQTALRPTKALVPQTVFHPLKALRPLSALVLRMVFHRLKVRPPFAAVEARRSTEMSPAMWTSLVLMSTLLV